MVTADQRARLSHRYFWTENIVIINTSRGECIDENVLFDSLKIGKVAGAGMMSFRKDPIKATLTKESGLGMEIQATQNLLNELN